MLKVADLQQFIDGLAQPLKSAGASQKVLDDLHRVVEGLGPFRDRTMAEFGDFLRTADQFVRTGELPAPGKRPARRAAAKAPKLSAAEAAQRILSLYERATDPTLDYETIEREVQSLQPLTKAQLLEVAEQAHVPVPRARKKDDVLNAIGAAIKERKAASERTGLREPTTEPAAAAPRAEGAAVGQAAARAEGAETNDVNP